MIIVDEYRLKLEALKKEIADLGGAMKITVLETRHAELEKQSSDPDFWNDAENNQIVLKEQKELKEKITRFHSLESLCEDGETFVMLAAEESDEEIEREIVETTKEVEKQIEKLRLETLLNGEYDKNNAILSFHAGAGGTEAQDWAMMLFRMHTRFAEKMGFKVKVMDYLDGDDAGMKSGVLLVEGTNAYGYLKSENGVHRLVRISPFDAAGKRHTSFASVEVMPEIDDQTNNIEIREEDLEVEAHRASGAGGQHINKTDSAIRIVHKPTGIVVGCQSERSQKQNKETALRMLKSKLIEIKEREHLEKIDDIKGDQKKIEWGSQIRSYVFMPYTLVKDHRTGFEMGNVNAVMDGELDGFVDAYLKHIKG
ncbi:MAG: peptide chain release factor 2 [Clostridiales bacterium]|nr:MAG: peptide chain release factor 2 [Clostridiales bacterium]